MLPDRLSDVSVEFACLPEQVEGATCRGALWQAVPDQFLLDAPDVARYLVEGGRRVVIDPSPQSDAEDVHRFLRMTPLAALLFQRGILAFHAAAVAGAKGAILIAGDSGAGKSTLAAAMIKREWNFLADDLAIVDLDKNGIPMVFPTFPELILWSDTMEKMEIFHDGKNRHFLPMEDRFIASPQPLAAVFRLSVLKEQMGISPVKGTQIFNTLASISYNSHIADALFDRAAYMQQAASIAGHIPIYNLRRQKGHWQLDELENLVEGCL